MKTLFTILILLGLSFNTQTLRTHHQAQHNLEASFSHRLTEPIKVVLTNTSQPTILPNGWGVTQTDSYYKSISNLNSSNWVVGDQKIEDYTNKIFDYVTKNNVTKCLDSAPFTKLGDNSCFNCTADKPLFDLKTQQCIACPTRTIFDATSHTCKSSQSTQCKTGQTWDSKIQKCVTTQTVTTPPTTTNCTPNKVWNDAQKKCLCPQKYPIDIGCQCVSCIQPFAWNATQGSCALSCSQTYQWNTASKKCQCPQATPYQINGQCIACNLPFQWDSTAKKCDFKKDPKCASQPVILVTKPTNATNTTTNTNTTTSNIQPAKNTTLIQNTTTSTTTPTTTPTIPVTSPNATSCSSNYYYDANLKQCFCPSNLPFNNGMQCVNCKLPQYWDHDLKKCLFCADGQQINTVTKICEPCLSGATFNPATKMCQSSQTSFIDPSVISYKERPTNHHNMHRLK